MLHTHKQYPLLKGTSGGCGKVLFLVSNAHSPWGGRPPLGLGPTHFYSVCLEIIGSGSIGVCLSRLRSSQMVVTLSSTISPDTQFAWNTLGMPPQPSPLSKTHSRYLNLALTFMSLTTLPPISLSAALSCSTFSFPVLFASVLHVWARVSAPCSRGQANSLLLYLFLNPITQSDWDCPSVNGMGILREIVWRNNKPTRREDKSMFKVLRSSWTTVQMCITFFFFWRYYLITVPPCSAWLSSFSTSGTHSDWLHCCHGDGTISIYKIMDRSVTGFASQRCLSAVGRSQTQLS